MPLAAVLFILLLTSCDPTKNLQKQEDEQIAAYLSQNTNLSFIKQPSGFYYLEVVAGTGISPVVGDTAYVNYTGKFLDGSIFDTNATAGKPLACIVGRDIVGFDEGLLKMKVGGKSTFLIPSSLGYGSYGSYSIPGYTPLLFDVELVKVASPTGK